MSNIDPTLPVQGSALVSQEMRDNFSAAATEIDNHEARLAALEAGGGGGGDYVPLDGSVPMTGPLSVPSVQITGNGIAYALGTAAFGTAHEIALGWTGSGPFLFVDSTPVDTLVMQSGLNVTVSHCALIDGGGTPLPTTDPHQVGWLWADATAGFVVKVSQG